MSCGNWFTGDHCLAMASFQVITKQMNGPDITHTISKSYEGEVRRVLDMHPHNHMLLIYWNQLQETLTVPEDKFQYLKKI